MTSLRKVFSISVLMIMTLGFVPQLQAEIPSMTLRWANFLPETLFYSQVDNYFAQEIEKRTQGKVKIKVFHGSTLGRVSEMPKLVSSGAIDIGNFPPSYFVSQFPMSTALGIPMMTYDPKAATDLTICISNHPLIVQETQKNKLYPFLYGGLPPYRLQAKNPIKTLDDLKNLKVRSFGSLFPIVFKSLGMVPLNIEPGDVYEGLQRGVVDASFGAYSGAHQLRTYEVAKVMSTINFGSMQRHITYINLDIWNKFPQELKDIWNEVDKDAQIYYLKLVTEHENKALDALSAAGATVVNFQDQDKLQSIAPDMISEWVAYAEKLGHGENAKALEKHIRKCINDLK